MRSELLIPQVRVRWVGGGGAGGLHAGMPVKKWLSNAAPSRTDGVFTSGSQSAGAGRDHMVSLHEESLQYDYEL